MTAVVPACSDALALTQSEPVFDAGACGAIARRVLARRDMWIPRSSCSSAGGFATLGCATYLDVSGSSDPDATYYSRVQEMNRILACEFGDVLDVVLTALGRLLGRQIVTDPNLALPGFHIFWGTSLVDTPTDRMNHYDIQYRSLRWVGSWGAEPPRSFTVPVLLPKGGSSLDCWPIRYGDVDPSPMAHPRGAPSQEQCSTIWYELGTMLVQTDLWLHRIGRSNSREADDYRITLQGHLLEINGHIVAYW